MSSFLCPQRAGPNPLDFTAWPTLWARCWVRVRDWHVPPGWASRDWCDEARAQGVLAEFQARRDFDPRRGVPLDAFLYRRVVEAVWTRHRQEWSFGRRRRSGEAIPDHPCPTPTGLDVDTLARLQVALDCLPGPDCDFIRQLFWAGRREDDLADECRVSRQAVNKRKQKILQELRRKMVMP